MASEASKIETIRRFEEEDQKAFAVRDYRKVSRTSINLKILHIDFKKISALFGFLTD